MSRFYEGDDYDEEYYWLAVGRWEGNLRRAINGRKGQRALRELREALLALPERRLIAGELATPEGEVCTVGALVAYRRARKSGLSIEEAAKAVALDDPEPWEGYERDPETGDYTVDVTPPWVRLDAGQAWKKQHGEDQGEEHTIEAGKAAGLVHTLAWQLGWLNDVEWSHLTPEQRWERCLRWVESNIMTPEEATT